MMVVCKANKCKTEPKTRYYTLTTGNTEGAKMKASLFQFIKSSTIAEEMRENAKGGRSIHCAGWLMSGDWKVARAMSANHELCVIDAEHGSITVNDVALCVEVMASNGCYAIVRVPFDGDSRKAYARRCLDAGAIGILFPNIQNEAQAR